MNASEPPISPRPSSGRAAEPTEWTELDGAGKSVQSAASGSPGESGNVVGRVVVPAVGVLAAANVLNNRVARRLAPVTSAVAAGALVALGRRAGLSWPEMGFTTPRRGAAIGGALAVAVAAVYTAGVLTPRTRPLFLDERALGVSRARLLEEALVQVPLGTVLLEEVAFRGVLPAALRRSHGQVAAVAGASALFGLWHILPALDMAATNPSFSRLASGEPQDGPAEGPVRVVAGTVLTTALAGAAFHELRRRGGLAAPSLLHLATNTLGYFAARAARRLERRAGRPGGQAVCTTWKPSA